MSLIQEALRRRDEESGNGPGKIPPRVVLPVANPEAPPSSFSSATLPDSSARSRFWGVLTTLLAVGLVVAVSVLGWFFFQFAPFLSSSRESLFASNRVPPVVELSEAELRERKPVIAPGQEDTITAETVKPLPQTSVAVQPAVPEITKRGTAQSTQPLPPAGSAPVMGPPVHRDATAATSTESTVEAAVGSGPSRTSGAVVAMRSVAIAAKTSEWPRLTLNGVMAQTGPAQGSAIINGTMVEIGEKIEGVRLVEVRRSGVLLEFKGNTQFVRVGQSTY